VGTIGLLAAGVGAVMTPLGWAQFMRNREPPIQVYRGQVPSTPAAPPAPAPAPVMVGIAPTGHGAALGAVFSF
jgi:hypothetical protein